MQNGSTVASRRQFIKGAGIASAATLLSSSAALSKPKVPVDADASVPAKNLIFLVVDGLSGGTLGLAHHWQLRHNTQPLNWTQFYSQPGVFRAQQDTASANSPVTDSAAAASAWGSGQRVNNGAINRSPAGEKQKAILAYAKEAGKATGLVSTCRITHATPAGFVASVAKRGEEQLIAEQYLDAEVDVLLGGGARYFKAGALLDQFSAASYQIVSNSEQLAAKAGSPKLLGLFAQDHVPYRIDRDNDPQYSSVPSLPEMLGSALKSLEKTPEGFVLQVEAGRVDHAGHVNDPAAILHEFLEFDACIELALKYTRATPDTLLVVTTDHGTGGCQLNGIGSAYTGSGPALDEINKFTRSFEWLQDEFLAQGKFDVVLLEEMTGIVASPDVAAQIQAAIDEPVQYLSSTLTALLQPQLMAKTGTGWTSNNHTGECVDFMALGPGAGKLTPFMRNEAAFGFMIDALRLRV